ncbi:uncharacterized protein LOC111379209 [Olea europaea var. sylvestris]|uniref:uncharacterized protein LOC111379206 n=1 Tax=Olea europaea var. sylvestris TaxID=158386 RepID=UPI000C1CDC8D|nr:uncharacterized protein LOC111379206 [Olea europaea var. sylvestris]XP_022858323.1 uncharacterized protein LOC111379208 [Olea europaea var. sylvestris]XP_022858324.1 uncharacterized protein LOC111379209 [Olea europaea var. sylvestris]
MPLSRFLADALGVVTICLVVVLVLLGIFCIVYSFYFHDRIHGQGLVRLNYFSGPWIIRITFIFFAVWWGFGEIIRLNLLRGEGRVLNSLNLKRQKTVCKCYVVSNLGFAEPCLILILIFLLRATLQKSGTLSRRWNAKTAAYVLLYCLPIFVLQVIVILIGTWHNKESFVHRLPPYFTKASAFSKTKDNDNVALCTYPLLSTVVLGLFATLLTTYLFWLGRQILHLVINKGLQKRVYTLIFSISGFFPLRVLLLGLSVLSEPDKLLFDAISFLAFLSFLCCAVVAICMLVYLPIADSLVLRSLQRDIEAMRFIDEYDSLIHNEGPSRTSMLTSPGRNSASLERSGSISFRTMVKDETSGAFVDVSLFTPSQPSTPSGSPKLVGWPMLSPS